MHAVIALSIESLRLQILPLTLYGVESRWTQMIEERSAQQLIVSSLPDDLETDARDQQLSQISAP